MQQEDRLIVGDRVIWRQSYWTGVKQDYVGKVISVSAKRVRVRFTYQNVTTTLSPKHLRRAAP